jgi:hypothetical protein
MHNLRLDMFYRQTDVRLTGVAIDKQLLDVHME